MSFLKRISATVTTSFDRAISQIENHDAVAEAAAEDIKDAAARLKVQLGRVRAEATRLESEERALATEEQAWTERARQVAQADEARALACVARRQACGEARAAAAERLGRQRDLEARLERGMKQVSARLGDLELRRQELRGRELTVKGAQVAASAPAGGVDVEGLFERWEVEVTRSEIGQEADLEPVDGLADEFEALERQAQLKAELDLIMNDQGATNDGGAQQ